MVKEAYKILYSLTLSVGLTVKREREKGIEVLKVSIGPKWANKIDGKKSLKLHQFLSKQSIQLYQIENVIRITYEKIELIDEEYCTLSVLAEETTLPILSFSSSHNFFFKYKAFVGSVPLLDLSNSESRSLLFFTEKEQD